MKTEDILLLDCTKKENVDKLKRMLLKIKPVRNMTKNGEDFTIETLEKCLHKIVFKNGYRVQWITPYYEDADKRGFVMWSFSLIKRENGVNVWKGSVNSKSLWEMVAKGIIQVYADIKGGESDD